MRKLIYADNLIELCGIMADKCDGVGESTWHQFADVVKSVPAVDAVPVVRCIEYKHDGISGVTSFSMHQGELYISCENNEGLFRDVPKDGYCYCGEKVTES